MPKKPHDMLEFFRRAASDDPAAPTAVAPEDQAPALEPTPRLLLVRRSQIVVAAVATGLVVVLAFVLGLALGGDEAPAAPTAGVGGWVIRAISYKDDKRGEEIAQSVMGMLAKQFPDREVTLQRILSTGEIAVTVGSWVHHPARYEEARRLLDVVKKMKNIRAPGELPFAEAYFWRIGR